MVSCTHLLLLNIVTVFSVRMAVPGKVSSPWNTREPVYWLIPGRDTYCYRYSRMQRLATTSYIIPNLHLMQNWLPNLLSAFVRINIIL